MNAKLKAAIDVTAANCQAICEGAWTSRGAKEKCAAEITKLVDALIEEVPAVGNVDKVEK